MARYTLQPNENAVSDAEREKILANPGFGDYFADHMAVASWDATDGWHSHRLAATAPFQLHPSAGVLHYGQEIFEGMKAYRQPDGGVALFRPEKNAARFARSASRLSMPPLPEDDFLASVFELVDSERAWVPDAQGEQSLYLRPYMFASEAFLGVRASLAYTYAVIATPVGPYYPDPIKLWATPNYTRAAVGGTGDVKCGGNYAASLIAAGEAHDHGCGQVVWLDGAEHRWVEECGTMNIMFVTSRGELLTPSLGTILAGVTRDSILTLASEHGLSPLERKISIHEVFDGVRSGEITEVLACGTAAVITPIVGFAAPGDDGDDSVTVGDGTPGEKTLGFRSHLLDIQYGRIADTHGWMRIVGAS
ncbi:MAG TPA: branched-chain amino acid aminotransferase [Propionibacteriaceae bacterium]|nr:branched-chain amino acid aminotransferase [Propionibacteriaceae bacterium]